MTSVVPTKLSAVAQFDDLCRYTKTLTAGCEGEFKNFVEGQKQLFRKLKELQSAIDELNRKNASLDAENKRFVQQVRHIKSILELETQKRRKLEDQKLTMEKQIELIKELVTDGNGIDDMTKERIFKLSNTTCKQAGDRNLTRIEESVGLLSDCDLTSSDENLSSNDSKRKKRHSKGNRRSSGDRKQKKKKSEVVIIDSELQSLDSNNDFRMELDMMPQNKIPDFRSNSEPHETSPHRPARPPFRSDSDQVKSCTYDFRKQSTGSLTSGTPRGRYSTGGKLSRTHAFVTKTVIRTEKCLPCRKVITFCKQVLKCSDCRVTCHPECREKCPLPCVPVGFTPTKAPTGTLADYTSTISPMIPSLIVQCVNEIELRGLKEIGLYRISGSEREVKLLKDRLLKGRNVTTLNQMDIHAVCGTIKEFLRSLSEPLITRAAWHNFVQAAEERNETVSLNSLYSAVCDLPQPNKETLAYLILHLQRVAATPACSMPIENLAKVFGPTIVGYSTADPSGMLTETTQQFKVVHKLLQLPADSWENLLNCENSLYGNGGNAVINTPELTPAPVVSSRLGPIYSAGQRPKVLKTPLTPRSKNGNKGGKKFFPSPLLK